MNGPQVLDSYHPASVNYDASDCLVSIGAASLYSRPNHESFSVLYLDQDTHDWESNLVALMLIFDATEANRD
jgi:hypothetical protein